MLIALRQFKTPQSFGRSECNRVKRASRDSGLLKFLRRLDTSQYFLPFLQSDTILEAFVFPRMTKARPKSFLL